MAAFALEDGVAQGVRPPSRMAPPDWAGVHVHPANSERGVKFDADATPWLREPMTLAADNEIREMVISAPVGSGKTTFFEGLIAWLIAEDPGPTLVVAQTDEDAKDWAETRLHPMLKQCRPLAPLWPDDRHQKRKLEILWPHMPLFISGANISGLQSKSIRWVLGDEVWLWKPGMIEEARRRTHDRWNSRVILVSQGGVVGDGFDQAWGFSDQREFRYLCRGCGGRLPWEWRGVKWEDAALPSGGWDWNAIECSTRYECVECGEVYRDTPQDRREMANSGAYEARNGNAVRGHVGWTYPAMAVWWIPWGKLVREWVLANEMKRRGDLTALRQFIQKRLAQPWEEEIDTPVLQQIGKPYWKRDFHQGERIDNESVRFLTVDVQKDHFWAVCRAWESTGDSSLIWEGRLEAWEMIRDVQQRLKVENRCVFVDGRYETEEVAKRVRLSATWDPNGVTWNILMGDDSDGYPVFTGKRKYYRIYSNWIHRTTTAGVKYSFSKFSNLRTKDMLAVLISGKGPEFRVPQDVSEDYRSQMSAEHKVEKRPGKWVWKKIKDHYGNHLWDAECMQVVAASILRHLGNELDPPPEAGD